MPLAKYLRILPEMANGKNDRRLKADLDQTDFHQPHTVSLQAYASDGSIYSILPNAVVIARDEAEAISSFKSAIKSGLPITPRGGGTGLAGGALGRGVIIDCSRLTAITEVSRTERFVECQPGIIYRDLNQALAEFDLFFPPDPSSGDSCQIGGMLANNSSGPRSVKYGLTSHYVERLTIINAQGEVVPLKKFKLDSGEWTRFAELHPEYVAVLNLLTENKEVIRQGWPNVKKNSSGYNLLQVANDLEQEQVFNLPALYVGSEGTLGLFLSARLRLLSLPGQVNCYRLFYHSLESAGKGVTPLLTTNPSALEIVDGKTLDLIGRKKFNIPDGVEAMLIVEYDDGDEGPDRLKRVEAQLDLMVPPDRAVDEAQRSLLWAARKAIVPTLYKHDKINRPLAFIEDASLPVEAIVEFIEWIRRLMHKENLTFGLFGHIGDGNLHIRPLININDPADFELMRRLYKQVYERIFELGGSSTAEHADGRLRAPVVKQLYGEKIYNIFSDLKSILDPDNRLNPDVILSDKEFTDDLDFEKVKLICAACGKCNGYCPAFETFRREDMSPRGWLRMIKLGHTNGDLSDYLEACFNCKNCTTVCPAGVDIAGEILDYRAATPHPIAGKVISIFDNRPLFETALKVGSLANGVMRSTLGRKITARIGRSKFGWDEKIRLPQPVWKNLRQRHRSLIPNKADVANPENMGSVAYFHGCADNYFKSRVGDALIKVLNHYNIKVALPEQTCCGLPMEVYGHKENLIKKAKFNIDRLLGYQAVVFSCASCLHRLAEYEKLFEMDSEYYNKAISLNDNLFDISQYLNHLGVDLPGDDLNDEVEISYHHPCHLRAAGLENEPLDLLDKIKKIKLQHPQRADRCCGQAGSHGYINYREGQEAFAAKKAEYRKMKVKIITSSCPSCIGKVQQEMGADVRVCHPIEIIADLIDKRPLHGTG